MSGVAISILLFVGCFLFILSVIVRAKTAGKYEIKMIDLTLVLIPLLFWLIGTGKIQKFAVAGVEFETAAAFIGASEKSIETQVALTSTLNIEDVVQTVESSEKGGVSKIPKLIKNKTEALEFTLGHGGYWGPAIKTYFESLDAYAYLRYAIIYNKDGTLFGVFEAKYLLRYFRKKGVSAYHQFAEYLNRASELSLKDLPGFIPGKYAVSSTDNKRFVLETMEDLRRESLPVVDSNKRFLGMVDRTQLTASLIIDVAKKLESIK
jgi:hypothetical protein